MDSVRKMWNKFVTYQFSTDYAKKHIALKVLIGLLQYIVLVPVMIAMAIYYAMRRLPLLRFIFLHIWVLIVMVWDVVRAPYSAYKIVRGK